MKRWLVLPITALIFAASASAAWTPLHVGSTGPRVRTAQYLLQGHNHFHLRTLDRRISGVYGKPTASATRRAKYWLGYPGKALTGSFGPSAYDYLRGHTKLPGSFRDRRFARLTLHRGATGTRVKDAQWLLQGHNPYKLRTYTGPISGRYTLRTAKAAWWSKYFLGYKKPIYGTFGPQLRSILRGRMALPTEYRKRRTVRLRAAPAGSLSGFAAYARTTVGTAYRWGGTNPFVGGADCSGLIQYLYSRYWGKYIPRSTYTQVGAGQRLSRPTQVGDLIFYHGWPPGHVTMYMGNGQMIEDPHTGATVRVTPVRSGIVAVRRYLPTFLPGGFQTASAGGGGPTEAPWWTVIFAALAAACIGFAGAHVFMHKVARKIAHEVVRVATEVEENLDETEGKEPEE